MDADPCNKAAPGDSVSSAGYFLNSAPALVCLKLYGTQAVQPTIQRLQYNQVGGGSTELNPEEADTYSFGVVVTPESVPGLSVSLDWYDIEVTDAISSINPETTLIQCLETGDAAFCDSIGRGLNDTLWLGLATVGNGIDARSTNIGFYATSGVDVEVNYSFDIGNMGSVNITNIAGIVTDWEQEEYPGAGTVACDGIYGGACGVPTPEMKNRFQRLGQRPGASQPA